MASREEFKPEQIKTSISARGDSPPAELMRCIANAAANRGAMPTIVSEPELAGGWPSCGRRYGQGRPNTATVMELDDAPARKN